MTIRQALCILLTVPVIAVVFASEAPPPAESRTITGVVIDPAGAPVSTATVRLVRLTPDGKFTTIASLSSDRAGNFELQTTASGPHDLVVSAKGMRSANIKLSLTGKKREINLGTIKLELDCSSPDAHCDDFGLGKSH
jgi:hypothetical protein